MIHQLLVGGTEHFAGGVPAPPMNLDGDLGDWVAVVRDSVVVDTVVIAIIRGGAVGEGIVLVIMVALKAEADSLVVAVETLIIRGGLVGVGVVIIFAVIIVILVDAAIFTVALLGTAFVDGVLLVLLLFDLLPLILALTFPRQLLLFWLDTCHLVREIRTEGAIVDDELLKVDSGVEVEVDHHVAEIWHLVPGRSHDDAVKSRGSGRIVNCVVCEP
jgi:hypothetical protein